MLVNDLLLVRLGVCGGPESHTLMDLPKLRLILIHRVSIIWPLLASLCARLSFPQRDAEQKRSRASAWSSLSPLHRWTQ